MKFLRKINKGLILTLIVITALVIYLVQLEAKRSTQKPEIEKNAKEYIEIINKYNVANDKELSEEELKTSRDYIKEEIKPYLIENEYVLENETLELANKWTELKERKIKSLQRKIQKIKKYVFDGDKVTLTIKCELEVQEIVDEQGTINKQTEDVEDTIMLNKENDKWKISYIQLQYPMQMYNEYDTEQVVY